MRTWQVDTFYPIYEGDTVTHTYIQLSSRTNGFATFGETVVGDHRNKPDDQKIQLALDAYFKSEYADKAMAESVQTVGELANWKEEAVPLLAELKKAIKTSEEISAEAKAAAEENRVLIKTATLAMNDALSQVDELIEKLEEKEDETIRTIETTGNGGTADE